MHQRGELGAGVRGGSGGGLGGGGEGERGGVGNGTHLHQHVEWLLRSHLSEALLQFLCELERVDSMHAGQSSDSEQLLDLQGM